jgi:IS605 OrfB family transposase
MSQETKSRQITKVIRLEIVKPVQDDWNSVGKKLREIQRITAEALNYCIRKIYLAAAEKHEELKRNGEKITQKALGNVGKSFTAELGQKYSDTISSFVYDQLSDIARKKFRDCWFDVLVSGKISLPSYKNTCPIFIRATGASIFERNNQQYVDRILALKLSAKSGNRIPETEFILYSKSFDDSRLAIWNRLLTGEYKLGMVQLIYSQRKHKWFANISYSFEPVIKTDLDPGIRVGVDLGIGVPVCLAVNNGFARAFLHQEGESIQSFRLQLEKRRRRMRRNERKILERRSGHGRRHKIGSIEKLRDLEDNFRRTANHRLSRGVINFALEQRAGVIVLENLEGYTDQKAQDAFLKTWTYFELQNMIEQKAKEYGIEVEKVKPAYTSQRCSKCGHIAAENRKDRKFCCLRCGYNLHADYNAARNIATPNIEKLIAEQIKQTVQQNSVL